MKFVVLTTGGAYGLKLVQSLKYHGITPTVVIPRRDEAWKTAIVSFRFYTLESKVELTGQMNSKDMEDRLKWLNPDYILLGGSGIIKSNIIQIPTTGVLNSHPGLLPSFRNVGVVGRALMAGCPVGCTLHYVDDGIDTGSIIERRLLPIERNWTLDDIEHAADDLCIRMLVEAACRANSGEELVGIPQIGNGEKCTWLSDEERNILNGKIRDGLAYHLYQSAKL